DPPAVAVGSELAMEDQQGGAAQRRHAASARHARLRRELAHEGLEERLALVGRVGADLAREADHLEGGALPGAGGPGGSSGGMRYGAARVRGGHGTSVDETQA